MHSGLILFECNDCYTFFFILQGFFSFFLPIFWLISHIFGVISGEKLVFSKVLKKVSWVGKKMNWFFVTISGK